MYGKTILGSLVMALTLACPAQGREAELGIAAEERVSLAGIDLDGQAGAELALDRITRAASDVCGGDPRHKINGEPYVDALLPRYRSCRISAIKAAVAELDRIIVTLTFNARFPGEQILSEPSRLAAH